MKSVLIMLSTYNGERFLCEQLDSIYAQEGVDIHVLVRDDGSKDSTIDILKKYSSKLGRMTILEEKNVGAALSFYNLMKYAYENFSNYDYYAFSDQDDVWMPLKLYTSVSELEQSGNKYKLFYGHVTPVNSEMQPLTASVVKISNCLQANIISNRSLGCTQVMNFGLLEKAIRIWDYISKADRKSFVPLHDAWTALIAYAFSGHVVIGESQMYYRQHEQNVIGYGGSFWRRQMARVRRFMSNKRTPSSLCQLFLLIFNDAPVHNLKIIERVANYNKSFFKRISLAITPSIYKYGIIENIGTFFVVILGKL